MNERELLEKLEREKEFIARKHELLSQHDDEERRSERSNRSSQRCSKRTKDWVMQTKAAGNLDEVVIEQAPVSLSSSARHPEETCLGSQQIVHPSSTPLKTVPPVEVIGVDEGSEVKSIPRVLRNVSVEHDSDDSLVGAVSADMHKGTEIEDKDQFNLSFVDLQPYSDLLKIDGKVPSIPSAGARASRFGDRCYKRWSGEMSELRQRNALRLQNQSEFEPRAIEDLMEKHQLDIDSRRKRETDLVSRIQSLHVN